MRSVLFRVIHLVQLLLQLLETPIRYLFGRDIFISYSRAAAKKYAPNLALALQAEKPELSFYLDTWIAPGSVKLPRSLRRDLRWSSMLVLVCTNEAVESPFVKEEVRIFSKLGRKVLPIDVDGSFWALENDEEIWRGIGGASPEKEIRKNVDDGNPSKQIVDRILKMIEFTIQDQRLKRSVWGTLCLTGLIIGGASVYSYYTIKTADLKVRDALSREDDALNRARLAEDKAVQAENRERIASTNAFAANRKVEEINGKLTIQSLALENTEKELRAKRKEVSTATAALERQRSLTAAAEAEARKAAEAQRQAEALRRQALRDALSSSAKRINDSREDMKHLRSAVRDSLQYYVDWSLERSSIPSTLHSALTDAVVYAKSQGLRLGIGRFPDVADFDTSPNGSLLITVGTPRPSAKDSEKYAATIWDIRTRHVIDEIKSEFEMTSCTISPDSSTAAIGFQKGEMRLVSLRGKTSEPLRTMLFPPPIRAVRFTASGKRLLVLAGSETGENLFLVDPWAGTQKPISFPRRLLGLAFPSSLQYAPLFIGAIDLNNRLIVTQTDTGEQREWDLNQKHIRKQTGDLSFIEAALAPQGRWLLVAPEPSYGHTTSPFLIDLHCVSKQDRKCVPVHRLDVPIYNSAPQIGFSPNGKYLLIGGSERTLHVYRMGETGIAGAESYEPVRSIATTNRFKIQRFSADGEHVVLAVDGNDSSPYQLQVYRLDSKILIEHYPLDQNERGWHKLKLRQAYGGTFQVGLKGHAIHIWERKPSPSVDFIQGEPGIDLGKATDATIAPDGSLIATAHPNDQVALWRLQDRSLIGIIDGLDGDGTVLEWAGTSNDYTLYAASKAGQLIQWSPDGTLVDLIVPKQIGSITRLYVSDHGQTVAVHGDKGPVGLWTGETWVTVDAGERPVVALSEDGRHLAVARPQGNVDVLDLEGRKVAELMPPSLAIPAESVYFAMSDERVVATLPLSNHLVVWDVRGGAPLTSETTRERLSNAVTIDSTARLWARYLAGEAWLVDLNHGNEIAKISGRSSREGVASGSSPTLFAFAPSSDLAAVGSAEDLEILVWKLSSGEALGYVPVSPGTKRIEFLPDGDALLLLSPEGFPMIIPFDIDRQFLTLCPLVWSEIEEFESSGDAYKFCWETFEQAKSGQPVRRTSTWMLRAAPRR